MALAALILKKVLNIIKRTRRLVGYPQSGFETRSRLAFPFPRQS